MSLIFWMLYEPYSLLATGALICVLIDFLAGLVPIDKN